MWKSGDSKPAPARTKPTDAKHQAPVSKPRPIHMRLCSSILRTRNMAPTAAKVTKVTNRSYMGLEPPVLVLGHEHALHLGDQVPEVEGLGEHLGVGCLAAGPERDRGEAGDEHDADAGRDLRRLLGELDTVHLGHDDVGEEEVEGL